MGDPVVWTQIQLVKKIIIQIFQTTLKHSKIKSARFNSLDDLITRPMHCALTSTYQHAITLLFNQIINYIFEVDDYFKK